MPSDRTCDRKAVQMASSTLPQRRLLILSLGALIIAASAVLLLSSCSSGSTSATGQSVERAASTTAAPTADGDDLVIQVADVSETARFYPLDINGTSLEVIAVKASDGSIRTAFNTCQVCYDSGHGYYVQQGSDLVCQNCGNRFSPDKVEVEKGGCNPYPIMDNEKTVTEDSITVPYAFLKSATTLFQNWKIDA